MLQVTAAPRRAEKAAAAALEAAAMLESAATGPFGRNSLSLALDTANLRPVLASAGLSGCGSCRVVAAGGRGGGGGWGLSLRV